MSSDAERLIRFYAGGRDDEGRTLDEILGWDDGRLEGVHDYIQWLFPLPERSGASPGAPVLTEDSTARLRESPSMQKNLRRAFDRMTDFYGFTWSGDSLVEGPRFAAAARNWLRGGNHNHLRLTRILRSLRVLGLEAEAAALWAALQQVYTRDRAEGQCGISEVTYGFWRRAMEG